MQKEDTWFRGGPELQLTTHVRGLTGTLGQKARDVLEDLDDARGGLQRACDDIFQVPDIFGGPLNGVDDVAICEGIVEQLTNFIQNVSPNLIRAIDADDTDAAVRFGTLVQNLQALARGEARRVGAELTFGNQINIFIDDVLVKTGKDIRDAAKIGLPIAAIVALVVFVIWATKR